MESSGMDKKESIIDGDSTKDILSSDNKSAVDSESNVDKTQLDDDEKKKDQTEDASAEENLFKGITEDISTLSADLHKKMTSASAYVGKMLLDSTDEETDDDKESKETFINSAFNSVGKVASNVTKEMEDVAESVSRDMDQVAKEISNVAKSVTKEMENVSSSVTSSVALAMENMERVTVNMKWGVKESFVDVLQSSKIKKMTGKLVWSENKHEKEIKEKVLALSEEKTNFTEAPWIQLDPFKGGDFDFDYDLFSSTALAMLKEDEKLKEMRYQLVPIIVKEEQFWRNYFYRVQMIKQEFLDNPESDDDQEKDDGKKVEEIEKLDGLDRFEIV